MYGDEVLEAGLEGGDLGTRAPTGTLDMDSVLPLIPNPCARSVSSKSNGLMVGGEDSRGMSSAKPIELCDGRFCRCGGGDVGGELTEAIE